MVIGAAVALIVSCVATKKSRWVDWARNLALHEELEPAQEALVWTLSQTGKASTYWVKNDVTGVRLTASRPDLALPQGDALWQMQEAGTDDVDFVTFEDLVTGDKFRIYLDEEAAREAEKDTDEADGGAPSDTDSDLENRPAEDSEDQPCVPQSIQSLPLPLVSVGPYLFLKWKEELDECDGAPTLKQDRYTVVDLSRGEEAEILSDKEQEALRDNSDVRAMGDDGKYAGTVPFYNPAFGLSFVHIFAEESTEVSDEGETQRFANTVQISDNAVPEKLKNFYLPPDLVQAFGLSLPDETLGGFVAVEGSAETIEKQLKAFAGPLLPM